MATLKISFLWEDDGGMSYDDLIEQLIHLGADAIEEEEIEPEPKVERPKKQRKKQQT